MDVDRGQLHGVAESGPPYRPNLTKLMMNLARLEFLWLHGVSFRSSVSVRRHNIAVAAAAVADDVDADAEVAHEVYTTAAA